MLDDKYVAGLFDGEGCVRIQRFEIGRHVRYQVMCRLGMTYKPVIKLLKKTYGGSLHMSRHHERNPKHRPQYSWVVGSQAASSFLKRVLPFLIVKHAEALLAVKLQASINAWDYKSGKRYPNEKVRQRELLKREKLYLKISSLKRVSY